jgi:hypothetical protein
MFKLSPRKRFKLTLRLIAIILGIGGTFGTAAFIQQSKYDSAAYFAALVLIAGLLEFMLSDIWAEMKYPTRTSILFDALDRKLGHVKDSIMEKLQETVNSLRGCDKSLVNATVHLKVQFFSSIDDKLETGLIQLTDYYHGRREGPPWRITSCYKGIIGRCIRTSRPEFVNFNSQTDFEEKMIKEFGFDEEDLNRVSKDARSYYAYPIEFNEQVIGVLYLFSTEYQVFPKAIDSSRIKGISKDIALLLHTARIV